LDRTLVSVAVAALVVGIIIELAIDSHGGAIAVGLVSSVTFGLILVLIPRRYEVWADRWTLVFLWRSWLIPFGSLLDARSAKPMFAFGHWGIRFATAPSRSVEVRRIRGSLLRRPNLIISPRSEMSFSTYCSERWAITEGMSV
jgi:hypothetical protein